MESLVVKARNLLVQRIGKILSKYVGDLIGEQMYTNTGAMLITLRKLIDDVLLNKIMNVIYKTDPKIFAEFKDSFVDFQLLDKAVLEGIQFYVSEKSMNTYVDKTYEKLETYKKEDMETVLPFEIMSVTFEGEDNIFILSSEGDKSYSLSCYLVNHDNHDVNRIVIASIIPHKLPRIYIRCAGISKCHKAIKINLNMSDITALDTSTKVDFCMKTPRTCKNCNIENVPVDGTVSLLYSERTFLSTLICLEILKYYNKSPEIIEKVNSERNSNRSNISERTNIDPKNTNLILINKRKYIYTNTSNFDENGKHSEKRSSPCEHPRTEHYRHYKSGKKVFIKKITVNEGKGKKAYKV